MRNIVFITIGLIVLLLILYGVISLIFPGMIIRPFRVTYPRDKGGFAKGADLRTYGFGFEKLPLVTSEGYKLAAYFTFPQEVEVTSCIILLHGIGSCKEHYYGAAEWLAAKGIASVVFDGRAHGESEGEYCTFGFYEKEDVRLITDAIEAKFPTLPIGIWGTSLGGAIAIQSLEQDKRLQFGIIQSTFTSLPEVILIYQGHVLGFQSPALAKFVLRKAGELASFPPDSIRPIDSASSLDKDILLIHGDADKRIPIDHGRRIFEVLKGDDKEWYAVKGGGHSDLWEVGGPDYESKISRFIAKQIQKYQTKSQNQDMYK